MVAASSAHAHGEYTRTRRVSQQQEMAPAPRVEFSCPRAGRYSVHLHPWSRRLNQARIVVAENSY